MSLRYFVSHFRRHFMMFATIMWGKMAWIFFLFFMNVFNVLFDFFIVFSYPFPWPRLNRWNGENREKKKCWIGTQRSLIPMISTTTRLVLPQENFFGNLCSKFWWEKKKKRAAVGPCFKLQFPKKKLLSRLQSLRFTGAGPSHRQGARSLN